MCSLQCWPVACDCFTLVKKKVFAPSLSLAMYHLSRDNAHNVNPGAGMADCVATLPFFSPLAMAIRHWFSNLLSDGWKRWYASIRTHHHHSLLWEMHTLFIGYTCLYTFTQSTLPCTHACAHYAENVCNELSCKQKFTHTHTRIEYCWVWDSIGLLLLFRGLLSCGCVCACLFLFFLWRLRRKRRKRGSRRKKRLGWGSWKRSSRRRGDERSAGGKAVKRGRENTMIRSWWREREETDRPFYLSVHFFPGSGRPATRSKKGSTAITTPLRTQGPIHPTHTALVLSHLHLLPQLAIDARVFYFRHIACVHVSTITSLYVRMKLGIDGSGQGLLTKASTSYLTIQNARNEYVNSNSANCPSIPKVTLMTHQFNKYY